MEANTYGETRGMSNERRPKLPFRAIRSYCARRSRESNRSRCSATDSPNAVVLLRRRTRVRGNHRARESGQTTRVNVGNPNEFTLLELATGGSR